MNDEERQRKRDERERKKREQFHNDFKWILLDVRGRRFIWWLLSICHIFESTMTGNSYTFFKEGERNVGLRLLSTLMEVKPEAFTQMQREAITEQKQDLKEEREVIEEDGN